MNMNTVFEDLSQKHVRPVLVFVSSRELQVSHSFEDLSQSTASASSHER